MISFNLVNEHKIVQSIICRIKGGETAGIVTDGGTPGISDPGYELIQAAIIQGHRIEPLPGPNGTTSLIGFDG